MYLEFDEILKNKIEEITGVDYDFKGNFLPIESINAMLNDLICEIYSLEKKYNDFKQEVEDNYKKIPIKEQYGCYDDISFI